MSTLWIWTPDRGVEVIPGRHPVDCDGAKDMAAARLGKLDHEDELCCYSFEVATGTDVGTQEVFLVWVCEDYEKLLKFIKTPDGEKYAKHFRDIPPPGGTSFSF